MSNGIREGGLKLDRGSQKTMNEACVSWMKHETMVE